VELREAMRTQRAIRRLRPDPVDDEVLLRCADLAVLAPTGGNRQGVEFVFVRYGNRPFARRERGR
jgi:nitroreductase